MSELAVRVAKVEDAEEILNIYSVLCAGYGDHV